ncbi:MAG: Na/Pi symporter [Lysinibacillus sp.]
MFTIFGGIGLFLLGMTMLTGGLKDIAGDALKSWLNTFTKGRFSAIATGAVMTMLVQSSTATTLLTIGFVSAGLLTFVQSIGVIIGANIGSTSTGWIISLIGFKISLQAMSLPIIGVGVFMSLIAPQNIKKFGGVLTGFGLLFLGIDMLQQGMGSAQDLISFESIPANSFVSIFLLILIGIIMTVIMQASSAAMAATLTALFAGAIDFEQAAYLVIGQNIGTTATALFASIGASVSAKRTALTHFLFNVVTAVIVTIGFSYFIRFTKWLTEAMSGSFDEPLALAMFHTIFSLFGMLLFLPFITPFSKWLMKVVPEKENVLTKGLDVSLISVPSAAIDVSYQTLQKMMSMLTKAVQQLILEQKVTVQYEKHVGEVEEAIDIMRDYLNKIQTTTKKQRKQMISILHVLDHLTRLIKVLREKQREDALKFQQKPMEQWYDVLVEIETMMEKDAQYLDIAILLEQTSQQMAQARRKKRNEYFERTVLNDKDFELEQAVLKVESLLWIDRLIFHYWRASARMAEYVKLSEK